MKEKLLFLVIFMMACGMAMSAELTDSELNQVKNKFVFFQSKYYKNNVWDCQRSPANAVANEDWELTGFKSPFDAVASASGDRIIIDFGERGDRYLQFDIKNAEADDEVYLLDDYSFKQNDKLILQLKLYEADGTFVKLVSKYGKLQGLAKDAKGIFYEQEKHWGTLFTMENYEIDGSINYIPTIGEVNKLSELTILETSTGHIVNFLDGEDVLYIRSVSDGEKVEKPSDPVKQDSEFKGWYADKEFTTAFDFTRPITSNTSIYAKFESSVAIKDAHIANICVKATDGKIIVSNMDSNLILNVFDIAGQCVKTVVADKESCEINGLQDGIYIVKINNSTFKVKL